MACSLIERTCPARSEDQSLDAREVPFDRYLFLASVDSPYPPHQEPRMEGDTMLKLAVRYSRYCLTILASIGFRIALN
jgi:hypothetical protein